MAIKLTYVEGRKLYNSCSRVIKNSLKKELSKYTKLTPEVMVDVQTEVEKRIRKEFVITGKLLDFQIGGLTIIKDLKILRFWCTSNVPSWYSHEDRKDSLSCDPLLDFDRLEIKIPEGLQIDPEDFRLDVTDYEKIRDEECDDYAGKYKFKRFACSTYELEDIYFISIR